MILYVVKSGDTIESIASQYGVSPYWIIATNELSEEQSLVVGQTIVILIPETVVTVQAGDTLADIAQSYDISIAEIYQNNPQLFQDTILYPGEEIVIKYKTERIGTLSINGYAYPYINRTVLKKTLPYLTYLSIFGYGFQADGTLIGIEDEELISMALAAGVAPIMMLTTFTEEGIFSSQRANEMLNNPEVQANLIENILKTVEEKGYQGVDVDFEYIYLEDKEEFVNFVSTLTTRMNANGYVVSVALAPKTSRDQKGLLYEAHDYQALGNAANYVLLMTYEWGYRYSSPMAVAPINNVRRVLEYGVSEIDSYKIFMGVPNYGYDWPLPYIKGTTQADSLGNVEAVDRARQYNAEIQFDEASITPYFYYTSEDGIQHVVWFEDARSIDAKIRLVAELDLNGASIWNIMKYFPQCWLVINALYNIRKML